MSPLHRLRLALIGLITMAVVAVGTTAPASAAPDRAAQSSAPARVAAQPHPFTTERAYEHAYDATFRHYRSVLNQRPVPRGWGWPDMPGWIKEGSWWIKSAAKCGIGVGTFIGLGGTTKVALMLKKIASLARTDKNVRKAQTAARALGGFPNALRTLGRFAKSRGKDVSKAEKTQVITLVTSGGKVVAQILGVTSCLDMARKVL